MKPLWVYFAYPIGLVLMFFRPIYRTFKGMMRFYMWSPVAALLLYSFFTAILHAYVNGGELFVLSVAAASYFLMCGIGWGNAQDE